MRYLFVFIFAFLVISPSWSQNAPDIFDFNPKFGTVGETISINGRNFPTTINDLVVFFGGVQGQVISSNGSQIRVNVPAGTSSDYITVVNTSASLSTKSSSLFYISYGGSAFDATAFAQSDFTAGSSSDVHNLCACDFYNDGDNDFVVSNKEGSLKLYENTSTPSAVSFINSNIITSKSLHVNCADLNNDGTKELIVTDEEGNNTFRILSVESVSPLRFDTDIDDIIRVSIPNDVDNNISQTARIETSDLNGNGRQDLIISVTSSNTIFVLPNNSSGGNLSFDESNFIRVNFDSTNLSSSGLQVADLTGDGLAEIVAIPFTNDEGVYIFENTSTGGNISFSSDTKIDDFQNPTNIRVADFNMDGLKDIAISSAGFAPQKFRILVNESRNGRLQFSRVLNNNEETLGGRRVWGIDVGDLNGDGLLDIVTTSISSNNSLAVFMNTTNNDGISFSISSITPTSVNRNIRIVDVNGDAKPDIALANITGKALSILKNNNCVDPKISFLGSLGTVCRGNPKRIFGTKTVASSYRWSLNGTLITSTSSNFIDIEDGGTYSLQISSDDGECALSTTSDETLSVNESSSGPNKPSINAIAPICEGERITLSVVSSDTLTYSWYGPDLGEVGNGTNLVLDSVQSEQSGTYTVVAKGNASGCESEPDSTLLVVRTNPNIPISILNGRDTIFCDGDGISLRIPSYSDYAIDWFSNSVSLSKVTDTINVNTSGVFQASITETGTTDPCVSFSATIEVRKLERPTSSFTVDADSLCIDEAFTFTQSSTSIESDQSLSFDWTFGDGSIGSGDQIQNAYNSANAFSVQLTSGYTNLSTCNASATQSVVVVAPRSPAIEVRNAAGERLSEFLKCPLDSLILSFEDGLSNYNWSNNSINSQTVANSPGDFFVSANDRFRCTLRDTVAIDNLPQSTISIVSSTDGIDVTDGEFVLDENSDLPSSSNPLEIKFTAENVNDTSISWSPASFFTDPKGTNTTFLYRNTETQIILSGRDNVNGCVAGDTILFIDRRHQGAKVFQPGHDEFGCWEISNVASLQDLGCTIYIFDNKGSYIVNERLSNFSSDCLWNGSINGTIAEEGVYYYVLKCTDGGKNLSGSFLLVR